jgi:hypothetical protein
MSYKTSYPGPFLNLRGDATKSSARSTLTMKERLRRVTHTTHQQQNMLSFPLSRFYLMSIGLLLAVTSASEIKVRYRNEFISG